MKLILKGFLIGIGKIMPGVSGAMIAITLNEYNKIIESIANIKKDIYNNTKYLSTIGIGIILAIITMSKIVVNCLNSHYFSTMLLFISIILGGIIKLIKETKINIKDITISTTIIILMILLLKITKLQNYNPNVYSIMEFIRLIGIGIIDALSSIVPGISGTALLMYFGYYDKIITTFANLTQIGQLQNNIYTLIPFIIGFIIGTIMISKILNKLINKYPNTINTMVIIFMTYTIITLLSNAIKTHPTPIEIISGIILFLISLIISIKIYYKSAKKQQNKYT